MAEVKRWKYRLVYENGAGAMDIYWTDSEADANKVQRQRGGWVEGPLGDRYWGKGEKTGPDDVGGVPTDG